jgi:tetratricopeptide (TPR) repeat protein
MDNPTGQGSDVTATDYIREARARIKRGELQKGFAILSQAFVYFPENPLIVSYYGLMQAMADRRCRVGVETCKRALLLLKQSELQSKSRLYAELFLNLGKTYISAGKKRDALDAFEKGLKYENKNPELLAAVRSLGLRKRPPLPFLDRSNFINKYIGRILHSSLKPAFQAKQK